MYKKKEDVNYDGKKFGFCRQVTDLGGLSGCNGSNSHSLGNSFECPQDKNIEQINP